MGPGEVAKLDLASLIILGGVDLTGVSLVLLQLVVLNVGIGREDRKLSVAVRKVSWNK